MKNIAIILLGGTGTRFGEDIPKQFYIVNDKPLVYYTIRSFERSPLIDGIVLVANKNHKDYLERILNSYKFNKIKHIVEGGITRQESALMGLFSLKDYLDRSDNVLIHDCARPLVDREIIEELIDALEEEKSKEEESEEDDEED